MTPAQREAIQKAINDYTLKAELLRAEYQKTVKEILDSSRKKRIEEIKKSLSN